MTLARVRSWFSRLPPYEQDLPLLIVDGMAYTPRAALQEVERGTPLGARLQALIESGRFGTSAMDEAALAKLRLIQVLSRYPPDRPLVATLGSPQLPGRAYTPKELIEEIRAETPRGMQWIRAEAEHMRRLVRLR
jgi:hypothetical protein